MALSTEVVDLTRPHLLNDPDQIGAVGEIAVVQHQARITFVGILIKMINPAGVERGGSPLDPMHLIPLLQQELRQVTAVLPCDASDQCGFGRRGSRKGH